jgi:hypothetical protein
MAPDAVRLSDIGTWVLGPLHWLELDSHNALVTASATVVMALFTVVLALVTGQQAWLTRRILKLARQEFLSTHRPQLRVRAFRIISGIHVPPDPGVGLAPYGGGERPSFRDTVTVEFTVVNVGKSTGHLLRSIVSVQFVPSSWLPSWPLTGDDVTGEHKFEPGVSKAYTVSGKVPGSDQHRLIVCGQLV